MPRTKGPKKDLLKLCKDKADVQLQKSFKVMRKSRVIVPLKNIEIPELRLQLKALKMVDFPAVKYFESISHFYAVIETAPDLFLKSKNLKDAINLYCDN